MPFFWWIAWRSLRHKEPLNSESPLWGISPTLTQPSNGQAVHKRLTDNKYQRQYDVFCVSPLPAVCFRQYVQIKNETGFLKSELTVCCVTADCKCGDFTSASLSACGLEMKISFRKRLWRLWLSAMPDDMPLQKYEGSSGSSGPCMFWGHNCRKIAWTVQSCPHRIKFTNFTPLKCGNQSTSLCRWQFHCPQKIVCSDRPAELLNFAYAWRGEVQPYWSGVANSPGPK